MFGGPQQNAHRGRSDQRASAPQSPPPPRSADRGRVSSLPRWRGPASRTLCASDGEKELPPMPRSRIEIYWKTPETAPDGVFAQVRVTDDSGSDYLLPYPCELTEDGWVNAASGKPLAVRVTYWKPYVELFRGRNQGRADQSPQRLVLPAPPAKNEPWHQRSTPVRQKPRRAAGLRSVSGA